MSKKKHKLRADFRKHHESRTRENDLTRKFAETGEQTEADRTERVTGKGKLTRKRTLVGGEMSADDSGAIVLPEIDREVCIAGRVLRVQGLVSMVACDDGQTRSCATRRLLKQLATDVRHVVAAGDRVWVRPEGATDGIIERVEPRYGVLSRTSKGRQHLIVANIDQVLIVTSAAEPRLKPHLVDRYLVVAEKTGIAPVICINKIDLVEPADLVPLIGVYSQLGYEVAPVSAATGFGLAQLRARLTGNASVFTGQSGVGKSSLLNAIEPGLAVRVQTVSAETQKGRHTTTTAELFPLDCGGFVVDTPGIRQFALWDVIPAEVAGFFRELRPYVCQCRYPNCTHTHEDLCAVKSAVADARIDTRRYESYLQMHAGE